MPSDSKREKNLTQVFLKAFYSHFKLRLIKMKFILLLLLSVCLFNVLARKFGQKSRDCSVAQNDFCSLVCGGEDQVKRNRCYESVNKRGTIKSSIGCICYNVEDEEYCDNEATSSACGDFCAALAESLNGTLIKSKCKSRLTRRESVRVKCACKSKLD